MMQDFAILVGIKTYPKAAKLTPLKGPHHDLDRIEKWLLTSKSAGGAGLDSKCILRLTETANTNGNAQLSDIKTAVLAVKELAKAQRPGESRPWARRLYLYFAGHGVFPPQADHFNWFETAFLAEDWQPDLAGQYIPVFELSLFLMQAGYFEEIVVITDACRSKMLATVPKQSISFTLDPNPEGKVSRLLVCYAASPNEFAAEHNFDGTDNGVFTKALSEALVAAPRNASGQLTRAELKDFVSKRVPKLLEKYEQQNPRFEVVAEGERIILAEGRPAELDIRITFANGAYNSDIIMRDAHFAEAARIPAGTTAAFSTSQPPGEYLLEIPGADDREVLNYELEGIDIEL